MLTPEYMRQITEGAESIAEQMHQDIIDAMVRRIMQRLGRGDDYLLTSTDKWMIDLLRDSGMLLMDIQEALAKRSGTMEEEIAAAMRDAGVQSLARDDAIYKKAGLSVPSLKQSPYILRLMQRDYEKTSGLWRNMTGTTAEASQRLFIDEMDKAYRITATGAVSYTKAFGDAIDRIVRDGVKVQYPSGHTDTLETAALRALRTGIGQMSGDITVRRMEEMDWDIVLVSAHMGARPGDGGENPSNHAWWQGKYYSLAGKDKRFPLLREATGYGTGEGLMGWNCRHSFGSGTGDPKDNPFTRPDTEENKKAYRVQQNQRAIERGIRKLKRECMGLNTAIEACQDPAMKEQLQASYDEKAKQLKDANKEYAEYCDKHGTKQLRERIQIARWNREQADEARKAAWREEKKEETSRQLIFDSDHHETKERKTIASESEAELERVYYVDLSKEWPQSKTAHPNVEETPNSITLNGIVYVVDGQNVKFGFSGHELDIARLISEATNQKVTMVPKISGKYHNVNSPDFLIGDNYEKWDLKDLTGGSKDAIRNAISKKKKQADNFIIDITQYQLNEDEAFHQAENVFKAYNTEFVKKLIIIKNGRIIKAYKRE